MNSSQKRKILVPIFNRAHYGRLGPVIEAIKNHPSLELQIMVGTPVAYDNFWLNLRHSKPSSWRKSLPWYVRARFLSLLGFFKPDAVLKNDFLASGIIKKGFTVNSRVPLFFDGGAAETMAKSVGFGLIKIVDELKRLKPDIVFINADRFEMMAVALAASYMNIPIVHNEAGDISGTIDESVRHAITKLAHIHFTATEKSRKRVIQMGENEKFVFNVGSPAIDAVKGLDLSEKLKTFPNFDLKTPYFLVLLHPVTTASAEENCLMIRQVISVLNELKMPTIFLGSNIDARSADLALMIRELRQNTPSFIHLAKNLPAEDFYLALANAACAIGNSSSFIREGAYFGTPAVLVGSRQQNRERGENVVDAGADRESIKGQILKQLERGRYESSALFGDGRTSERIARILAEVKPPIQKQFQDK
jgi:UDP-hydrolysing UDP-N-acetyl-D-glucosamine 2-epimerase